MREFGGTQRLNGSWGQIERGLPFRGRPLAGRPDVAPRCRIPAVEYVFPSASFVLALGMAAALAASTGYAQVAQAPGAPVQVAAAKAEQGAARPPGA